MALFSLMASSGHPVAALTAATVREGRGVDIASGKHQSQRPLIGRKRFGGRIRCRVDQKIGTETGRIVGQKGIDQQAGALSEAKGADHGTGTADNTNRSVIARGNKVHPL